MGMVRRGKARQGRDFRYNAGHGSAGRGLARQGRDFETTHCEARQDTLRQGKVRPGRARHGKAGILKQTKPPQHNTRSADG